MEAHHSITQHFGDDLANFVKETDERLKKKIIPCDSCETVSWLKACRIVKETDNKILASYLTNILEFFGGVEQCLTILLANREYINTLQAIQLTDFLTEINNQEKTNHGDNKNTKNSENKVIHLNLQDIGTECIVHMATFLTPSEIVKSFNNVCVTFAIIGIQESRKADYFYMNGHNLIMKNKNQLNKYKYLNKIGFGQFSLLKQHRTFKDETIKSLFSKLSAQVNIPLKHLSIWNYTARINTTYRPNRQIKLNWSEPREKKFVLDDRNITQEMRITHTIPTNKQCDQYIKSIHQRIGNVWEKKRRVILLDERKIEIVPNINLDVESISIKKKLIAIKYFDLCSQTLYFADWIYIYNDTKMMDITNYIENHLICQDKYYFTKCQQYLKQIKKYEFRNVNRKQNHFSIYEEHKPQQIIGLPSCYDTSKFYFGDILIFQLNTNHRYFSNHPIVVESIVLSQLQQTVYQRVDSFILSINTT